MSSLIYVGSLPDTTTLNISSSVADNCWSSGTMPLVTWLPEVIISRGELSLDSIRRVARSFSVTASGKSRGDTSAEFWTKACTSTMDGKRAANGFRAMSESDMVLREPRNGRQGRQLDGNCGHPPRLLSLLHFLRTRPLNSMT